MELRDDQYVICLCQWLPPNKRCNFYGV
jgi:hypothetical protein